jgi:hypothetical protein
MTTIEKEKDPEQIYRDCGYTDGNYTCKCSSCGCNYMGSKRSYSCFGCAIQIKEFHRDKERVKKVIKKNQPGQLVVSRTFDEITLLEIGLHRDNKITLSGSRIDQVFAAIEKIKNKGVMKCQNVTMSGETRHIQSQKKIKWNYWIALNQQE